MPYCNTNDILLSADKSEVIRMLNDESRQENDVDLNNASDVCTQRLQEMIDDATSEIELYLERYTLPLNAVPTYIKRMCVTITLKNLEQRRDARNLTDRTMELYKNCIKQLEAIASGKINIPEQVTEPADNFFITNTPSKHFTDDKLNFLT